MQERSRKEKNILYIVVPCYNEEQVLAETSKRLKEKCEMLIHDGKIAKESRIVFVDDGSRDHTWNMIDEFHKMDSIFSGVKLSRNRGHQNALLAGLTMASEKADIVISMDADLQDDINAVDQMIEKYYEGCDIVYGVRSARDTDTFFKRFTAEAFYKLINKISDADIVDGARDFRLMKRDMVDAIIELNEYNRFSKGIFGWIGFRTYWLPYENVERVAGETKWSFWKLFKYAIEGIVAFTTAPLSLASVLGVIICFVAFIAILVIVVKTLLFGDPVGGWPSMVCILLFVSGIQLLCMGIIGQYLAKTYLETKKRPIYIVRETEKD